MLGQDRGNSCIGYVSGFVAGSGWYTTAIILSLEEFLIHYYFH